MLTARKLVQSKLHDVEMSVRGILRGFGLKVGKVTPSQFAGRVNELVSGHPSLKEVVTALLSVRAVLLREFNGFERRVRQSARAEERARLLTTTPGVGAVVALTFVAAIDDPARFKSSKMVGAHFGMTPKKYQSGQTDVSGRISKVGDPTVRSVLFEAAHVVLTKAIAGCSNLKSWAMRLAKRVGMKKAKVALARRLAVILHRMLVDATAYDDRLVGQAAAKA
jgi:transposase